MNIDHKRFAALVAGLGVTRLSQGQAEAIIGIARLAVDADKREDEDELSLYDTLAAEVGKLAGVDPRAIQDTEVRQRRGDDDKAERMAENADRLKAKPERELAYSIAYMLTIADLDIKPIEDRFLNALLGALAIAEDREEAITRLVNDAIIPD